jgi:hypothetical protein
MLTSGWRSRLTESMVKNATDAYLKSANIPLMSTAQIKKTGIFKNSAID